MAMIHLEPQTAQMFSRALGALKPPPNLTLSQWADNYRRLSAEASAAQGRWNTDNAPFQREIMDAIGDVHIRKVVAMMCAQSGKTDGLILNTIGYYMSYYPAPIMIVQPTVNLGESFSKDRLATMIRDTPVLRGLVDNKSRYSGNTIMKKNFAGGQLTIVGANAPTDLRGRPIKVLLADEVDAYKASAGKEGDPVMLAEQRQTTYWDYKTVLVSTPTDKNNSRILDEFNASYSLCSTLPRRSSKITWQRNPWKPPLWPVSVRRGRTSVMTDEELEHRLTAVENRAQSNTHRLDELGKLTDAVNGMNTNIKLTIQQLENTNKSLEIVTAQNKKQEDRLTVLEKAPGTFGNKLWWAVIAALVSGLVAYELTMLLH